jgi:hypothetical protein
MPHAVKATLNKGVFNHGAMVAKNEFGFNASSKFFCFHMRV